MFQNDSEEVNETDVNYNSILKFSSKFCDEVNKNDPSIVCSPLSAQIVLGLLTLGSTGTSREELLKALNMSDDENVRTVFKSVIQKLNSEDSEDYVPRLQVTIANRVYVMKTANDLVVDFKKDAVKNFDAGIEKIDFTAVDAVDVINRWVSSKTKNKIKDIMPPNSVGETTKMVLVNAIYFKGQWRQPFEASQTADRPFHINRSKQVTVPFMNITDDYAFAYNIHLDAKIAAFPFYGRLSASMLVVLPNNINGLASLIKKLATDFDLMAICKSLYNTELKVSLPKFRVETTIDLIPLLKQLGIHGIFESECTDLTGLVQKQNDLYVSMAVQKAYIDVDEKGCEAAAATAAIAVAMMLTEMLKLERDPCVLSINAESNHTA